MQHKNLCKTVTKITNFKLPSQNDIEDILGTLPPLNYKNVREVELEEELSEEVKELMNKLNDIPDGIPLVDIMVSLHEEHIDKDDNISHSSALKHSEDANMEIDEEELEEVLESDSEEEAKKTKSVAEIDGYDMDELAD